MLRLDMKLRMQRQKKPKVETEWEENNLNTKSQRHKELLDDGYQGGINRLTLTIYALVT